MAAMMEESFKVCGLCSQLVDESVEITSSLRGFLCTFLDLDEMKLPAKICLECYQRANECRYFKDRCDKAIFKLSKSAVYSAMILGGSKREIAAATGRTYKEEKMLLEAEKKTKTILQPEVAASVTPAAAALVTPAKKVAKPGPASKKHKPGPASKRRSIIPEIPPDMVLDDVGGPRASRSVTKFVTATPSTGLRSKAPAAATATISPLPSTSRGLRGGSVGTPGGKSGALLNGKPASTPNGLGRRGGGGRGKKDQSAKVRIPKKERLMAERVLKKFGPPHPDDGKGLVGSRKRKGSFFDTPPPADKKRKLETTSSGRVVETNQKSGYVFDTYTVGDDDEDAPISSPPPSTTPQRGKKAAANGSVASQAVAKKSTPAPAKAAAAKKKAAAAATPSPKGGKKKATPSPKAAKEAAPVSDEDEDMEEIFPTVGPYQCEICQKITDTKQEFVDHIKKYHIDVVDEEVLRSLESDLRKSRKKAEKAAAAANAAAPASSKKSPAGGKASKKSYKATTGPKSSPKAAAAAAAAAAANPSGLSEAMMKKKNAPIADRTCKICDTVLSSPLRADHDRHQKTIKCQQVARAKGLGTYSSGGGDGGSPGFDDPLSTNPSPKKSGKKSAETADELAQRTCQFCGKVLARKSDLPGHYKTKTCVAKQYEREASQEDLIGSSATPVVMENAEVDEGYNAAVVNGGVMGEGGEQSPSNLPSSTTNEGELPTAAFTKMEHHVQDPLQQQQASTTTNTGGGGGMEWIGGGPITTIADTLGGAMHAAGIDPLGGGQHDPFATQNPSAILDGLHAN